MKWMIVFCLSFILSGCRQIKEISEKVSHSETKLNSRTTDYVEKKDTTFQYRPAPEKSQNRLNYDSSFLETSLAWSVARWHDGILEHTIENKPSVPIRVPGMVHVQIHTVRDTVVEYLELTDEHTVTIEKFRFLNGFFYYSGCAAWFLILICVIWKLKRHLK